MKNLLMIGLLCLTFFAGQEIFAQETTKSEPTLTETLEFIEGKLPSSDNAGSDWTEWKPLFKHKNSRDGNRNFFSEGYDSFTFEGTKLKILTRYRQYRTDNTDVSQMFKGGCDNSTEIQLKDIDPSSIKSGAE